MKPAIRVHLHESPAMPHASSSPLREKGPLKLTALHFTRTSTPLSIGALLKILLRYPITLFMSLPRILKHAWILHYRKGLGVWRRPEPVAVRPGWGNHIRNRGSDGVAALTGAKVKVPTKGGGVGWQTHTLLESLAEKEVHRFLSKRAKEMNAKIVLVPGNPNAPIRTFSPSSSEGNLYNQSLSRFLLTLSALALPADPEVEVSSHLTISHLSARLFPLLLLSASASEALTAGGPSKARAGAITEFVVNDQELFTRVFGASSSLQSTLTTDAAATSLNRPNVTPISSATPTGTASEKLCQVLRSYKPPPLPPSPLLERSPPHGSTLTDLKDGSRLGIMGEGWMCVIVVGLLVAAEWMEWWAWKVAGVRWAGVETLSEESEVSGDQESKVANQWTSCIQ